MTAYRPKRDGRFYHASDAIRHVEEVSCSLGCISGAQTAEELLEWGPGGNCYVLAGVAVGNGEPIEELDDDGEKVVCLVREPIPAGGETSGL